MSDNLLPPFLAEPRRAVWRPWKIAGLAALAATYLFHQGLPGWLVAPAIAFGLEAVVNLSWHVLRYLRDRVFWRVRNRILGSFIFVGLIPLLLILGSVYLTAYIVAGQLAANYLHS